MVRQRVSQSLLLDIAKQFSCLETPVDSVAGTCGGGIAAAAATEGAGKRGCATVGADTGGASHG